MPMANPSRHVARSLLIRGLGVVLCVAFLSLGVQVEGLAGVDGLLPVDVWLQRVAGWLPLDVVPADLSWLELEDARAVGVAAWLERITRMPTLMWVLPAAWGLKALCGVGLLASVAVTLRWYAGPALLMAWTCYLSLAVACQAFLGFQWDTLLLETTLAATTVAAWTPAGRDRSAPRVAWFLMGWILFRLVFFGGLVKLTSGDPSWWDGTALTWHYETQPLPNPLSWYAHGLPEWLHRASTAVTFAVELVLVFGIFGGHRGRGVAAVGIIGLMAGLAATGNYGFFQLLTVVLALSLLDDDHWAGFREAGGADHPPDRWLRAWGAVLIPLLVGVSVLRSAERYGEVELPAPLAKLTERAAPSRSVNTYGLFATMTKDRPGLVLEVQWEDGSWEEIPWRWQPSTTDAWPAQVAPHMPRLDWQLWFAALGSCARNPWVPQLMRSVLVGKREIATLIGDPRLSETPPRAARMWRDDFRFTAPGSDAAKEGRVWIRTRQGPFCDPVTR